MIFPNITGEFAKFPIVEPAICGVIVILSNLLYGCSNGSGSFSYTSTAAPAISRLSNALIKSSSFISPDLAVFMTTALFS